MCCLLFVHLSWLPYCSLLKSSQIFFSPECASFAEYSQIPNYRSQGEKLPGVSWWMADCCYQGMLQLQCSFCFATVGAWGHRPFLQDWLQATSGFGPLICQIYFTACAFRCSFKVQLNSGLGSYSFSTLFWGMQEFRKSRRLLLSLEWNVQPTTIAAQHIQKDLRPIP